MRFHIFMSVVAHLVAVSALSLLLPPSLLRADEPEAKKAPARLRLRVQSVLPTRDSHAKHNPAVNDVNARLQKLANEFEFDFIDLHSLMKDDIGELKKELTGDGLHLNADGYKIWKAEIERVMGW